MNHNLATQLLNNAVSLISDASEADIAKFLQSYTDDYGTTNCVSYDYLITYHIKYGDDNATGNMGLTLPFVIDSYEKIQRVETNITTVTAQTHSTDPLKVVVTGIHLLCAYTRVDVDSDEKEEEDEDE